MTPGPAHALQIWSHTYAQAFDALAAPVKNAVQAKVDEMGTRLDKFPHTRLQGRSEYKLRVGDYRCSTSSTPFSDAFTCITSAIDARSTSGLDEW